MSDLFYDEEHSYRSGNNTYKFTIKYFKNDEITDSISCLKYDKDGYRIRVGNCKKHGNVLILELIVDDGGADICFECFEELINHINLTISSIVNN